MACIAGLAQTNIQALGTCHKITDLIFESEQLEEAVT